MAEEEERKDWEEFRGLPPDIGSAVVATSLAPQLGSDQIDTDQGRTDMRRLTVIEKKDLPLLIYARLRGRKSRVWRVFYDEILNLKVGIGGRGRRDIIRMEGVSKGGAASVESEITPPGWLSRNITQRNWERDQREARGV